MREFRIKIADEDIEIIKENILSKAVVVEPKERICIVEDDPDDNKFFEAALEGDAKWIVSQDRHLLKVRVYREINVVTPEEFLYILV